MEFSYYSTTRWHHRGPTATPATVSLQRRMRLLSMVLSRNKVTVQVNLPDDVIVVTQVKFLLVLPGVVHNSHAGDEIHYFLGRRVVQVVAALMSPVSVHPLQSQVAIGSSSVSHVRASVCLSQSLSRSLSDKVSFTRKDLRGGTVRALLQPNSRRSRSSAQIGISGHFWKGSLWNIVRR